MAFDKRAYDREWMKKRRDAWFAVHGPCVDCGSWENLELDHDNRSEKVSHRVWSWSEERRNAELAKCVARCRSCHRAKTNQERKTWSTKPTKPTLEEMQKEMRARLREQIILDKNERREAIRAAKCHKVSQSENTLF